MLYETRPQVLVSGSDAETWKTKVSGSAPCEEINLKLTSEHMIHVKFNEHSPPSTTTTIAKRNSYLWDFSTIGKIGKCWVVVIGISNKHCGHPLDLGELRNDITSDYYIVARSMPVLLIAAPLLLKQGLNGCMIVTVYWEILAWGVEREQFMELCKDKTYFTRLRCMVTQ